MALAAVFLLCLATFFPVKYSPEVESSAREFGLNKELVYSVIWTESKFNQNAQSNKGAIGLMQLMPATAKMCCENLSLDYSLTDIFSPEINIRLGTYYLSLLMQKFDYFDAIAAYNAGEGNVSNWISNNQPYYKETIDYVQRVKKCLKIYDFKNLMTFSK